MHGLPCVSSGGRHQASTVSTARRTGLATPSQHGVLLRLGTACLPEATQIATQCRERERLPHLVSQPHRVYDAPGGIEHGNECAPWARPGRTAPPRSVHPPTR